MGPGEKGSSIASVRVKIGSWGPKKILEGPSKAKPYPTKLYSVIFHFSYSFLLGGGWSKTICNWHYWVHAKYTAHMQGQCCKNYDKLMAVIGRLSLDGLRHPSQQMECACLLAALRMFVFDAQCFRINLDLRSTQRQFIFCYLILQKILNCSLCQALKRRNVDNI